MSDDELAGGRVRRGRAVIAGALALALLGALPFVFGLLARDDDAAVVTEVEGSTGGIPPGILANLSGRLVYVADVPGGTRQRLAVLDLAEGSVTEGPGIPEMDAIYAAGPGREWLLLVRYEGRRAVASVVREVTSDAEPVEVARGDLISLSPDGRSLLVADRDVGRVAGCGEPGYVLERVTLATGRHAPAYRGLLPCGTLWSATLYTSGIPVVSVGRSGEIPRVYALDPEGPEVLFQGHGVSSTGAFLFAHQRRDLFVWPGGGALRLVVTGSRLLGEVVASSTDGRHIAVYGRIGDQVGVWLVDAAAGTAEPVPPPGYPLLEELSDAAFDDIGTLFAAGAGRILALMGSALFPIRLPPGAPAPLGPVAWLP